MGGDDLRFNFAGARVAVLDRSKFSFRILKGALAGFGFRHMIGFESADEALSKLAVMPADLVFCDPYPDTSKVLAAVRTLREPRFGETSIAPIVVTTPHVILDVVKASRDAGVDFIVAKPFSASTLLDRIVWAAKRPGRRDAVTQATALAATSGGSVEIW